MGIIYTATFPNGFKYVGQTSQGLEIRKTQHKSDSIKRNKDKTIPFYNAINKYGFDNIIWEIIDNYQTKEEANEKEQYWIKQLRTYIHFKDCKGYNATLGGNSRAFLTKLNETQLKEIGKLYIQGISAQEISVQFNIPLWTAQAIYRGEQWSDYTKIPLRPSYKPHATIFNEEEIDYILNLYKQEGNISQVTRSFKEKFNKGSQTAIRNIIKGITWQEYTNIWDDSFYLQYLRPENHKTNTKGHCKITPDEVLQIVQLSQDGKNDNEILQIIPNANKLIIHNVLTGKNWNSITHIK